MAPPSSTSSTSSTSSSLPPRRAHNYREVPGLCSLPPAFARAELQQPETTAEAEAAALGAERTAIRARAKLAYLTMLNDPERAGIIEDPAMVRFQYARTHNIYPNFRPTTKTSLLGLLITVVPLVGLTMFFYNDRKKTISAIESGTVDRTFKMYG